MFRSQDSQLGDLELAVLDRLWAEGPQDAKTVHGALRGRRSTLNTVQSALKRLHDKGLLSREKVSHAYIYGPAITREDLHRRLLSEVSDILAAGAPEVMLAAFVDLAARAGRPHLEQLEVLVEARLADEAAARR